MIFLVEVYDGLQIGAGCYVATGVTPCGVVVEMTSPLPLGSVRLVCFRQPEGEGGHEWPAVKRGMFVECVVIGSAGAVAPFAVEFGFIKGVDVVSGAACPLEVFADEDPDDELAALRRKRA